MDNGGRRTTTTRRDLLTKGAVAGGIVWAAPTIESFLTPAAALSGSGTTGIVKSINGANTPDPANSVLCVTGGQGNAPRGSVTFTRTDSTNQICATITTSGPSHTGRNVFLLQSDSTTCLGGATTPIAVWPAGSGPNTYCTSIVAGATFFAVSLNFTGGGGTDGSTSGRVNLP